MNDAANNHPHTGFDRRALLFMVVAAAILMITMGMRQSLGLFIAPIIDSTHVGYAAMSFALAVGQLMWGVAQPTFGALADRYGANRVLLIGALHAGAGFGAHAIRHQRIRAHRHHRRADRGRRRRRQLRAC